MVKVVIGNIMSRIIGFLPEEAQEELDQQLSYSVSGSEYSPAVKQGKWDGVSRLYKKHYGQSFLTGLLSIVLSVLDKHKIVYQKVNDRVVPPKNLQHLKFNPPENYENRDYQQFTIDRCLKRTRGIIKMATGAGKTLITAELVSHIQTSPFMFYVLTNDLLEQAYGVLSSTLNEPIGRIGGGEFDVKKINVCTVQTAIMAVNYENKHFKISDYQFDEEDEWDNKTMESVERLKYLKKVIYSTKGVYFDEVHHVASRTAKEVMEASPFAYWRFGGSATPYRDDGADILIQAMFGKKIVDISASYLIEKGFLIEPYIIFEPIHQDCKLQSYKSIYSQCIAKNDIFNTHVADTASFLMKHNLSTLILVKQISQGNFIQKLLPGVDFLTSNVSKKKRLEAINKLRNKNSLCLIATTLADEGLDIPTLDAALLAGGGSSATRVHQRIGRTLRIDKNAAHPRDRSVVICYDHDVKYLRDHSAKTRTIIRTEPKFHIVKSKGPLYINDEISQVMSLSNRSKTILDL